MFSLKNIVYLNYILSVGVTKERSLKRAGKIGMLYLFVQSFLSVDVPCETSDS